MEYDESLCQDPGTVKVPGSEPWCPAGSSPPPLPPLSQPLLVLTVIQVQQPLTIWHCTFAVIFSAGAVNHKFFRISEMLWALCGKWKHILCLGV